LHHGYADGTRSAGLKVVSGGYRGAGLRGVSRLKIRRECYISFLYITWA